MASMTFHGDSMPRVPPENVYASPNAQRRLRALEDHFAVGRLMKRLNRANSAQPAMEAMTFFFSLVELVLRLLEGIQPLQEAIGPKERNGHVNKHGNEGGKL